MSVSVFVCMCMAMDMSVRRWFMIVNNQLVYRKRSKDDVTVMEDDLRLCTVKLSPDLDRRFCLEVLSPARYYLPTLSLSLPLSLPHSFSLFLSLFLSFTLSCSLS